MMSLATARTNTICEDSQRGAGAGMMKISDIVNKEFSRSFMGYDMREVDCFLDEIIEQMETY